MPCRTPYLLLWTLGVAACASAPALPVITVTPEGPFEWNRGRAMHYNSDRGVNFSAAFERDRGDYLEWWIRIDNHVDGMLGFDPPSASEARHARDQQRATYLAERDHQERWRELLANRTVRRSVLRPGESLEGA